MITKNYDFEKQFVSDIVVISMDEKFMIVGRRPLRGKTTVCGSKNAASKMMVASLLTDEPCFLKNIPLSGETEITKELCEKIGSRVEFNPDHTCRIETREIVTSLVPEFSKKNRIPILTIGPLVHRRGFAEVPVVGGDQIGHRPIDFHIAALAKMGIKIEHREHSYYAQGRDIQGAEIEFPFPSVGATENVLLTAVLAKGKTIIRNAAIEPEIKNLTEMLTGMGAEIEFDETNRLLAITGVARLTGVTARVIPDRNEIVSLATAALVTGGDITVEEIEPNHILAFLEKVREVGGEAEISMRGIRFKGNTKFRTTKIQAGIHPGFMTDWQQPFCVLLTQAQGESIIHETVYEDRFSYTKDLIRLGANIKLSEDCLGEKCRFAGRGCKHTAFITGPTPLKGTDITMTDIRAGMAHIIAALAAEGESVISGIEHIDRGYEKIDERLRMLGADMQRVSASMPKLEKKESELV